MKYTIAFWILFLVGNTVTGNATGDFDLESSLKNISKDNRVDSFPYRAYISSVSPNDLSRISSDLKKIDSFDLDGGYLLFTALTDSLYTSGYFKYRLQNFDSVAKLILTAEKYKVAAELDPAHHLFYESVWDYWLNICANFMTDTAAQNKEVRLNHKFIYLTERLAENKHVYSAPPLSDSEKIIYNVSENRWFYLISLFWVRTKWWFKALLLMVIILFGIMQITFYRKIKNLPKQ